MNRKIIRILTANSLLLFVFIFTKCSPIPVYRLQPVDNHHFKRWIRGHQVLRIDGHKYGAALAFDKQVNNLLVFDLQVINKSDSMISVIPDSIYSVTYTHFYKDSLGHELSMFRHELVYAHNPEKELIRVDKQKHKEDADMATDQFLNATSSLLDVAYDVSSAINPPPPRQRREHERSEIENNTYMTKREAQHANIVRSLSARHFQWSTEALRRTDLTPNETIRGLIFITADPFAKFLKFHLNIAGEDHVIYFLQKKYK